MNRFMGNKNSSNKILMTSAWKLKEVDLKAVKLRLQRSVFPSLSIFNLDFYSF